ncbi:subtilase-type protease inhibitor [Nocardia blacklockiae]|uniref:subtilase-type protease inhibitor n=1 Tax=Nocardia blacklockiae TaxID=480036 RepID=UPI001894B45E|nr:subtilase-type protease inhibitor [Nocardia blacklockiae]MBF6175933.1 subtilase-type protease inhibitor [Nocardia blacklockiae]
MRFPIRALVVAPGVLLAALALTGPAHAQDEPGSRLTLSVAPGDQSAPPQRTVTLDCQPAGGTHPDPQAACAQLTERGGDLDAVAAGDEHRMCTMIWDPVTVRVTGTWESRPVDYQHTFANTCALEGAGATFRF